ncbi:MAG TPA: DUF5655 domain-containing protein [Longimicrobiales bacterium]|nr:DUF5655 domain-containing protein [Longimicrobiales bacterium]
MNRTPPPGDQWLQSSGLWLCPACGKAFKQRGLWHACVVLSLDHHFAQRPRARELFDAFQRSLEEVGGPFRLSIAQSRIGFITRMTFAAVMPRRSYLRAHFLLLRRIDSPRIIKIEQLSPYWVHNIEIRAESDLDEELRAWLQESYAVGAR